MKLSQHHLRLWLERNAPKWAKRENLPREGLVSVPPVSLIQASLCRRSPYLGMRFSVIDAIINERVRKPGPGDYENNSALALMRLMRTNARQSGLDVSYYAREAISAGGKNDRRNLMILRWMYNLDKRARRKAGLV